MKVTIKFNNKILDARLNKSTIVDELYTMCTEEVTPQYRILKLDIHPKQDIILQSIEVEIPFVFNKYQDKIYSNGFQSQSESRLFSFDEMPDNLKNWAKPFVGQNTGDYTIDFIPRKLGVIHSWTYGFVDSGVGDVIDFIGSLNESTGFTCVIYDADNQVIRVKKDIQNLELSHSFPALHILLMKGKTSSVWDTYFQLQVINKREKQRFQVWSSGLNATELSVENALEYLKKNEMPCSFFHIDNTWQEHLGDVLTVRNTFPKGLDYIAQFIHNQGLKASISFAPLVVEAESIIFKTKQNWLLKDKKGQLVKAASMPESSILSPQWLYVLDFYNKDVQEYLTGVFHTLLDKWHFDVVKLEYLFAACIEPRANKNRGQIMSDVMQFLRQLIGNKMLWAADVPMALAWQYADFWSLNSPKVLQWESSMQRFYKNRERQSVALFLRTLLSKKEFQNSILNSCLGIFKIDKKASLTKNQRDTLFKIAFLTGNPVFDIAGFEAENVFLNESLAVLKEYPDPNTTGIQDNDDGFYIIQFECEERHFKALCNLNKESYNYCGKKIEAFQTLIVP